jgi:predicted rRNA methylase YqxC with S4 and FtsJ domains
VIDFIEAQGHLVTGVVPSPITGTDGNQEFFVCARKRSA